MSSSVNEDQEQRKNASMEDPNAMTIEFLRARLLSERSVSKTARQRADELAKRVEELEEQLQFVTLQRKKAEIATADVLAILEDHGISDVSEGFDSSSDHEETLNGSNSHNDTAMGNEASTNIKVRRNDTEAYSSSEIDSSPLTGRSLSWKSGKDLQYSFQRKKHKDLARRRASFTSTGYSSMRWVGKSCRRIRHGETRSAIEELQNDVHVKATYSSDIEPDTSRKSREHDKEKNQLKNPPLMSENHRQETNGHYFGRHGRDNDMERALQHQAQLIGQYEEEEKAQREWEEKFRDNNSYTPDSYELGNHSDVTEEQGEIKAPELPYTAGATSSGNHCSEVTEEQGEIKAPEPPYTAGATSSGSHNSYVTEEQDEAPEPPYAAGATSSGNHHSDVTEEQDEVKAPVLHRTAGATSSGNRHSDVTEEQDEIKAPEPPFTAGATSLVNQEMKTQPVEACFNEEPQTFRSLPSIPDANNSNLPDQRCSGMITFESSAPKFSQPMSIGSSDQQFSGKHLDLPLHSSLQCLPSCTSSYPSAKISLSDAGNSIPMYASSGSTASRDLAAIPQETFDSVLEKLKQAKMSLKQKLNSLPLVPGGTSGSVIKSSNPETNNVDKFKIPVAYPGLFRLPTDNEFEAINRGNRPSIGTQLGFTNISSDGAGERFFSNPFVESRNAFVGDQYLSVPSSPFTEIRPGVSMQGPLSQPRLAAGPPSSDGLNYGSPHTNMVLPSSSNDFYPFLPDFTLRLPSGEGISRTFPSSELGVPPVTRFSLYDDFYRPNVYR
ncbi:unnamed protein product [Fraxinus pennsylvanica]|uniref:Uncharacterized protein n=1 Tax=Fraxinus pennsylvanica TaxID=56036 RepID=A0AAD1Z3N0_9LAMI|nr:unnamed protein product [Fraxinus pennsylvanica]